MLVISLYRVCNLPEGSLRERRSNLISKKKKSQIVNDLSEKFSRSKAVIFTEYKGLTVSEISGLRRQLKETDAEYKVVKNTLINIAASGASVELAKDFFSGPTGLAIAYGDPVEITKKVLHFAEKNDKFKVKSGIFEGRLCSFDEMKEISVLPSRTILLGMFGGVLQSPMSKLAFSMNETITKFARALETLKNNREKSGGT